MRAKKTAGTAISMNRAAHPAVPKEYQALLARLWSRKFFLRTARNCLVLETLHNTRPRLVLHEEAFNAILTDIKEAGTSHFA